MDTVGVPTLIALVAASVGAVTDVWRFRVYNALTVPLLATGILYHGFSNGSEGLSTSAWGALFGFGILIVPYMLGLMGAGDVKLMAGVGAWVGYSMSVAVFVATSFVAGFYAVVLIVYRGKLAESLATLKLILYRLVMLGLCEKGDLVQSVSAKADRRLRAIPFGAMVPFGIIFAVSWQIWWN